MEIDERNRERELSLGGPRRRLSAQCDVVGGGDWFPHCRSLTRAGELLLCSAADAASCALWFWVRDNGISGDCGRFVGASLALATIPIRLLGSSC